tara:strand:+ start:430 stop:657 length:228 start_codon:yes stop_codon:yes gene_type:complete
MNCHKPDPNTGRTTLFTFLWQGGGYNQVYARDITDAEEVANTAFGGGTANLRVRPGTVRAVRDITAYHNSHPCCD